MNIVHVVGRRHHGKTTLMVDLVTELTRRGLRVGTIKHSRHTHELDNPGKDSHRHRNAGAVPAAIVSAELAAVFLPRPDDPYAALAPLYQGCDLILVEGDVSGPGPSIEVHRVSEGGTPLARERNEIVALVSDDDLDAGVPVWPRADVPTVVERLLALVRR